MATKGTFAPNYIGNAGKKANSKRQSPRSDNFLEALRDIGGSASDGIKRDLIGGIPQDILKQWFGGFEKPPVNASGEIQPGQSINLESIIEAERSENKVLHTQLVQEKRLREEEQVLFQKKSQELKVELHALVQEVGQLAKTTQGLAKETQIAAMQAPANPGVYHVNFFEKLREYIASFRKKIESAANWMQSYNQRAAKKKTFWGQVGKGGAKRLLSQEDYVQRSAG